MTDAIPPAVLKNHTGVLGKTGSSAVKKIDYGCMRQTR
jgi:hypothetical protein